MKLRDFEIAPIKTQDQFTAAENFVDTLDTSTLDEEEKKFLHILLELMDHYDEKYIVPQFTLTPGELLQYLLEENGFSQYELAKELGVKQPNINGILKGTRDLSKDLMKKIHTRFKIPYEAMF